MLLIQAGLVLCIFIYKVQSKVHGGVSRNETFKNQFCTDPRTQKRHGAYTEWADAYSCSRHRCRPGTHRLAIYTVGCKQVEPPESAIECEQVVEDTNMQFPYCCTRLRCLVVVRGEVWTKVLGQPFETLPAAPWSHMYKMKRAPPEEQSKATVEGPVYELSDQSDSDGGPVLRSQRGTTASPDCDQPDILIAVQTGDSKDMPKKAPGIKRFELRTNKKYSVDAEETDGQISDDFSDEPYYEKTKAQLQPTTPRQDTEPEITDDKPERELQDLVSRMRDVETAVLRMGQDEPKASKQPGPKKEHKGRHTKRAGQDGYKRFSKGKTSKAPRTTKSTTELPLFVEDTNLSGYFSDHDDVGRRGVTVKEPSHPIFVAAVEPHKSAQEKKKHPKKKHHHARKRTLSAESRKRRINRLNSLEADVVSLENGSAASLGYR